MKIVWGLPTEQTRFHFVTLISLWSLELPGLVFFPKIIIQDVWVIGEYRVTSMSPYRTCDWKQRQNVDVATPAGSSMVLRAVDAPSTPYRTVPSLYIHPSHSCGPSPCARTAATFSTWPDGCTSVPSTRRRRAELPAEQPRANRTAGFIPAFPTNTGPHTGCRMGHSTLCWRAAMLNWPARLGRFSRRAAERSVSLRGRGGIRTAKP